MSSFHTHPRVEGLCDEALVLSAGPDAEHHLLTRFDTNFDMTCRIFLSSFPVFTDGSRDSWSGRSQDLLLYLHIAP
jgi:hypothetical protein